MVYGCMDPENFPQGGGGSFPNSKVFFGHTCLTIIIHLIWIPKEGWGWVHPLQICACCICPVHRLKEQITYR